MGTASRDRHLRQPPHADTPITLAANCAGARSSVNPHAACDVADVGNGATENPKRARRGKPWRQDKDDPTGHRATSDPTRHVFSAGKHAHVSQVVQILRTKLYRSVFEKQQGKPSADYGGKSERRIQSAGLISSL